MSNAPLGASQPPGGVCGSHEGDLAVLAGRACSRHAGEVPRVRPACLAQDESDQQVDHGQEAYRPLDGVPDPGVVYRFDGFRMYSILKIMVRRSTTCLWSCSTWALPSIAMRFVSAKWSRM